MLLPTYLNLMHVNKIYLEAKSSSRFNTIQMQPFEMVLDIAIHIELKIVQNLNKSTTFK